MTINATSPIYPSLSTSGEGLVTADVTSSMLSMVDTSTLTFTQEKVTSPWQNNPTTSQTYSNVTSLDEDKTRAKLSQLSDEKALLFMPVMVFIGTLMFICVIGNLLVIYVYCRRYKSRSSNYFIITMAIFDLLAGLIAIPLDIYDLRFHYTFYNAVACKLFRYSSNVTTIGSAIILIMIAFDRYFKICQPLKIGKEAKTKTLCYVSGILAALMSIPALILFGIAKTTTEEEGLSGYDCSIEEQYQKGLFRRIYYILLMLVFAVTFGLLAGLYIRIWVEIRRRKDIVIGDKVRQKESTSENVNGGTNIVKKHSNRIPSVSDDDTSVFVSRPAFQRSLSTTSKLSRLNSITEAIARVKVSRTTKIFFAVTIAFVLSYLPGLVIQVLKSSNDRLKDSPTLFEELIMKLFARSHYINNAINPVIYSFLNVNFRTHCKRLFRSFIVSCKRAKLPRRNSSRKGSFRKVKISRTESNPTKEYEMDNFQNHSKDEMERVKLSGSNDSGKENNDEDDNQQV